MAENDIGADHVFTLMGCWKTAGRGNSVPVLILHIECNWLIVDIKQNKERKEM